MEKYADKLKDLLATEPTFTVEDKINKNYIASLARQYDKKLLELLSSDKDIAEFFFVDIDGSKVFKKDTFLSFINNKEFLPDSYTMFKSKIGLGVDADNYLSEDSRVVLNWPYKDCVLEGGQDKEDQKRDEVFFNEILAPDQINTILDDKVFVNWKRYDKDGEHDLDELKPNDNLIIKGNNLVVLHSLKKRFAGRVKLIYIDPPYNTGNDGFNYNDSFNHSTWLTFMKNRLMVAKGLLTEDGVIFISCDDNEQAYLKVLCDEIFGRENFIANLTRVTKKGGNKGDFVKPKTDYVLSYFKDKTAADKDKWGYYVGIDKDSLTFMTDSDGRRFIKGEIPYRARLDSRPNQRYYMQCPDGSLIIPIGTVFPNDKKDAGFVKPLSNDDKCWTWSVDRYLSEKKNNRFYFYQTSSSPFLDENGNKSKWSVCKKVFEDEISDKKEILQSLLDDCDNASATKELSSQGMNFSFPKPEELIYKLINIATDRGDIVLDYHLGSGTTAAVAHKMGRQYIGIEQLYYGDNDSTVRLQNVINGEQAGISKDVRWTGGGSFVYCNIKNDANTFREKVRYADEKELEGLLDQVLKSSFLSYRVDPKKVSKKEFEKLSLADKKRILVELVDNNTLYLNYSEINDNTYNISEADKRHNKEFYGD